MMKSILLGSALAETPFFPSLDFDFDSFTKMHSRKYTVGSSEYNMRKSIFEDNVKYINEENEKYASGINTYKLGITPFADKTVEEFQSYLSMHEKPKIPEKMLLGVHKASGNGVAESIDWRTKGAVTGVKNQGACGSCWSFSSTGALEGAMYIHAKKKLGDEAELVSLSEQALLDCDMADDGCNGGWMPNAFIFVKKNGLCTEKSFPYKCSYWGSEECQDSQCPIDGEDSTCTLGVKPEDLEGFKHVWSDVESLKDALSNHGPVSVAIEADRRVFMFYIEGIIQGDSCGTKLDHGVLAVGYGSENGVDYWIVKNSWGPWWGENGYVRIGNTATSPVPGTCGILKAGSFPVIKENAGEDPKKTLLA